MRSLLAHAFLASSLVLRGAEPAPSHPTDTRCYELRTYTAAAGKLDALHARFRDHTLKIFEKHGMTNLGYWVPIENPEQKLIYLLSFDSADARTGAWKAFGSDPEWQAALKASETNGPLVTKVESLLLQATDFSPAIKASAGDAGRVFELRTYTATDGHLPNLLDRFRQHTVALFAKHGMTNVGYWTLKDGQPGAAATLIYFLAHKSAAAAKASFDSFRLDPAWVAAKDASEKAAGGSLTVTDGVKSLMLKPTDYSPTK